MVQLSSKSNTQTEIKEILRLSIPLASAQIAQAATGFVDTVMMGWLGQETLAAGGLAATILTTLLVTATGVIFAVSPAIAEAFGGGNRKKISQITVQGFWLCVAIAIPVMFLINYISPLMLQFGQNSKVVSIAKIYFDVMLWGFFPALTFAMLKSVISSLSQVRPIIIIVVIGTLFNAAGNYVLGFGKLGFPVMGLSGLALASVLSQWLMLFFLIIYILKQTELRKYQLFQNLYQFEPKILQEIVSIGIPIGISLAFEVGLFSVTTYLMGLLGTDILAAHLIVFQSIAIIFMVPLGISFATTIRVGFWKGQNDAIVYSRCASLIALRRSAYISMILGGGFMIIMAIFLLIFSRQVISLYLDIHNPENTRVISLAIPMFVVASISQILDGVQTTAAGALRGLKDTRIPMLLSFVAFWGFGLGSGYLLAFKFGLDGVGLWIGQAIGVATSAGVFIWRFRQLAATNFARK
ncbi:MATE family efflux transporter [Brunnivagina elsteri]|uniref:Probable multidrug resistance protein NorM n=1 Tax=Brunnivagina elsteri CCALA 953 TaxID=987040 RepID=A0A2A2TK18_9CYAN|nr:MATE family efflux transporter [Calothrix elsteri]PAX55246.1 MATE family efflux transporter [Calothrix elsteri CCALA 953]